MLFRFVSYRDPPVGVKLTEGTFYNPWFGGGGVIGMPPPLEDGLVEFEDGTPATVSQMVGRCKFMPSSISVLSKLSRQKIL